MSKRKTLFGCAVLVILASAVSLVFWHPVLAEGAAPAGFTDTPTPTPTNTPTPTEPPPLPPSTATPTATSPPPPAASPTPPPEIPDLGTAPGPSGLLLLVGVGLVAGTLLAAGWLLLRREQG